MERKINILWVSLIVLALVAGFMFGKANSSKSFNKNSTKSVLKNQDERDNRFGTANIKEKNWKFINPLLDCGDLESVSTRGVEQIKQNVLNFIEEQKKIGNISDVSVYFRDLNNGPWFGIKEKEGFLPASLLKVPLMMGVFRQVMEDPGFLSRQFVWTGAETLNTEYFKAEKELKNGHTYSVDDAVEYMIRYSDNNSLEVLSYALNTSTLLSSYSELGILPPDKLGYSISARTYGSFFRILYNSTFLNKEYSEDALRLLSETQFDQGLVKGLPSSIKVAHKFGERQLENGVKQLHDCGIVYYPNKPYLLCVMTRTKSSNFDKLADFISKTSRIVYEGIDNEN